jgi:hypothetical protein
MAVPFCGRHTFVDTRQARDVLDFRLSKCLLKEGNTMQDFSSLWLNYLENCQRSWQDMARLWTPNFPATAAKDESKPSDPLNMFSPDAWLAMFSPWLAKDANNDALASLTEAARASLNAFAPWSEAFSGRVAASQTSQQPKQEDKELSSAERAVRDAVKRSNTQDV